MFIGKVYTLRRKSVLVNKYVSKRGLGAYVRKVKERIGISKVKASVAR